MTTPDVVYIVGPHAETCEELRYSLRSVAENLPHGKVWIVGTVPSWARNVEKIELDPASMTFGEAWFLPLHAAVSHPALSETFVFMNDDFFFVEPVEFPIPVIHVGPVLEYLDLIEAASPGELRKHWVRAMCSGVEVFGGNPNCYETHTPLHFDKARLRAVMDGYPSGVPFNVTAVYHLASAGGEGRRGLNVKFGAGRFDETAPYLSTSDQSFESEAIGRHLRALFPRPCRYEAVQKKRS